MKYSEIKELYKNVDQEIIREYYEDFRDNGLSILSAALNLGIENDLGGMYEYVCEDKDIEEYKNEIIDDHFDSEEEKDEWISSYLQSYNGFWFQLVGDVYA